MGINLKDPTIFYTSVLVGDSGVGSTPPSELTQVGGFPVAAAFELQSTLGGFLFPRLTDTQMNALTPLVDGMVVYNTTNTALYCRQGGSWAPVGSGGGGSVTSLTQGANIVLTPSPITTTGSVALNPVLTGLTSAVIGNISISTSANTISGSGILNINANGTIALTATAAVIDLNSTTQIHSGFSLKLFNPANTFSTSITAGTQAGNISYTLPVTSPSINGQMLTSTTAGVMSWVTPGTGTVSSITAGSNLTGGTITGSGTIALSNAVSGLTSLAVGNLTMSGTTIASGAAFTLSALAAMDLSPTQLRINAEAQMRSANTLRFFNAGNTFSTSFTAPALAANLNYTLPLTAPTDGQVLSSLASGVMSWVTAGSGSVTSISQGANIVCTPNPIVGVGSVALNTTITNITSMTFGTSLTIDHLNNIQSLSGNLTIQGPGQIIISGSTGIVMDEQLTIEGNAGIKLNNTLNTFSTSIIPGNVGVNTTYTLPSAYPASNGYVLSSDTIGTMSWVAQSGGGITTAKYLLQTADGGLPNAQAMGALATGIVKNTTTTGVQSIAVAGTDYYSPGNPTTIRDTGSGGNLFLGTLAGVASPSGTGNCVFGDSSLDNLSTGNKNSIFGIFSGTGITSQGDNCLFGYQAGQTGSLIQSVMMGSLAGSNISGTCTDNTFLGYRAGSAVTSATQVTLLGSGTTAANALTNATAIGYSTIINTSNAINLGNSCFVGINTQSPAYALHISAVSSNAFVFLANSSGGPSVNSGGGILYINNGALIYVGGSGTSTIVAPA